MPFSSSGSEPSDSSSFLAPAKKRKQSPDSPVSDENDEDAPQRLVPVTASTVLSHAERRRQKKKEKQQQQLVDAPSESPRKKRKLVDGTVDSTTAYVKPTFESKSTADDPKRQRRQNSVWVGNLSFRTTRDALLGFFDGVGTITRAHLPMQRGREVQGENMGFAYVDFETPEAKTTAITLSEGQLDGRNLLIKDGDDFTGRPDKVKMDASETGNGAKARGEELADGKGLSKMAQKILRVQKQPPAPTLFLGNLGFETTEASIRELFEAHRRWGGKNQEKGKGTGVDVQEQEAEDERTKSKDVWIRKIRMGTFEDSGACKGFAFVDFTSIEHATTALVNPRNHRLNGRDLVVEYASPDAVRRGGGSGPRNPKDRKSRHGNARTPQKDFTNPLLYTKQRRPQHGGQEDNVDVDIKATPTPSRRPDRAGHDRRRAKPGAALADAQRQSAAILPGQGQKIVF